jgi:hypothetical protein
MKTFWILALLCSSIAAHGLSGGMEKAVVNAMQKVPCKEVQSSARHHGILAELVGGRPDGGPEGGPGGGECIEYELRTEKVSYVIRPRIAILLLLGADVYIKLINDELLLRTSEAPKDIHCAVLAMSLRSEEEKKERRFPRICLSESGAEVACSAEPEPFR